MADKALTVPDAARVTTATPWAQIAGLGSTHHTRYDDAAGSRRPRHPPVDRGPAYRTLQTHARAGIGMTPSCVSPGTSPGGAAAREEPAIIMTQM